MTSTRFAVGTHILAVIDFHTPNPVNSAEIAKSVNTSAAVVRQILMRLKDAGLVDSVLGKGGGSLLARPSDTITLWEIFEATEDPCIFATHRSEPWDKCIVGRHILPALSAVTDRAQAAMQAELEATSLADVVGDVLEREKELAI